MGNEPIIDINDYFLDFDFEPAKQKKKSDVQQSFSYINAVSPEEILFTPEHANFLENLKKENPRHFKQVSERDNRHWKHRVNEKRRQERTEFLTQRTVERSRPKDKEYVIYHKSITGFGLRIRPTGHKSYIIIYKNRSEKTVKHTIGNAATMTLDEAENKAKTAIINIRENRTHQEDNYNLKKLTLSKAFREYMIDYARTHSINKWYKNIDTLFRKYVEPDIGAKLLHEIKKVEVYNCIQAGGTPHVRRHIRAFLSSFYSWCVCLDYTERNLVKDIPKTERVKSRDRILSEEDLAIVWNNSYKISSPFGECIRLLILSGQGRSEVAELEWDEIDFQQKIWKLPEHRSKNKHSHTIPLSDGMLEIISGLTNQSKYVFESSVNTGNPINSFSKIADKLRNISGVDDWCIHDLRRTVASGMAKIGILPHVIEAVIGHRSGAIKGVAAVYNRYGYENEKRQALEQWGKYIAEISIKHKDLVRVKEEVEIDEIIDLLKH